MRRSAPHFHSPWLVGMNPWTGVDKWVNEVHKKCQERRLKGRSMKVLTVLQNLDSKAVA